ncbi:hypothetical protein [Pseudomonas panipatensis]|jgi:hypothetical protein|uniref:Lipoprotein n=1 Tax=Pseudomonas panipatensis TaxID=428992 RepID=A0A1G8G850_9PSED|nr:hypothetical protein [Pseudomonas panipatensis]SDH90579.1 hypothetical protein SAMN05216272_10470 [Pseudomonas panipatensis]SMP44897.1 hypothetical protein SAMN06295951_101914 [Pseudomonas panipatensis]
MKSTSTFLPLLATVTVLSGCMSDQQFLASNQQAALNATTSRAKFELNCQDVTPSVLSSKVTQARVGYQHTEYTIGVRGCGKQAVYITYCLNPQTCNAIADTARIGNQ